MKDKNIIIVNEKRRVYIFRVNMLLKPKDMGYLRSEIKRQIKSGVLVLPNGVELVSVTKTKS